MTKFCANISQQDSSLTLKSGNGGSGRSSNDPWNYFHINSVDKDASGNYLISARNYASIYKINGTTGDVIWTLGGLSGIPSDFKVEAGARFAFQHDARFVPTSTTKHDTAQTETISFFDNGAHSADLKLHDVSRARIVVLDHVRKTAVAEATFLAPGNLLARSQGNAQLLPNGNVFVNWGQAGGITEFGGDTSVLFHASIDSNPNHLVQSYRGFKGNWTGTPSEEPAIVAIRSHRKVAVYVSWNGDTETSRWLFYSSQTDGSSDHHGTQKYVGQAERKGFETRFDLPGIAFDASTRVYAEALDASGEIIKRTPSVSVVHYVLEPTTGSIANEDFDGQEQLGLGDL